MKAERLGPLWLTVATGVALSLAAMVWVNVRFGGFVLGGTLLLAAASRAALPEAYVHALKVRARWLDVLMYVTLAAATLIVFGTVKL